MALKVHHLRPAPGAHTKKTRVGRGEGSKGKTAGRGTKGSGARQTVPQNFEGGQMPIHMRLPKLKGFKNPFRVSYQVVNVGRVSSFQESRPPNVTRSWGVHSGRLSGSLIPPSRKPLEAWAFRLVVSLTL